MEILTLFIGVTMLLTLLWLLKRNELLLGLIRLALLLLLLASWLLPWYIITSSLSHEPMVTDPQLTPPIPWEWAIDSRLNRELLNMD